MSREDRETYLLSLATFATVAAAVLCLMLGVRAHARPNPAWEMQRIAAEYNGDQQRLRILKYLSTAGTLRYPSNYPNTLPGSTYHQPCCGQADAYEADALEIAPDGSTWAILTCNDPDNCQAIDGKVVRPPGTKIRIPPEKVLVNDPANGSVNDTGHGWVWIAPNSVDGEGQPIVYCYTEPTLL